MDLLLEATARAERQHCWFRGFRAFTAPAIASALAGRSPVRILDAGCGTGHNLAALAGRGRATGVDLAWRGLQFARGRPGPLRLAQASVAALPFPDAQFDLVTCFDVFQCLSAADEASAAREIARVLAPGGRTVINVSAFEALRGGHSVLTHELHRYRRAGLRRLLEGAGLEIERITYTFATLLPLIAAVRLVQQIKGLPESDADAAAAREIAVPVWPVNAVLTALLRIEALALRVVNMPAGTSILCVARKPPGRGDA